MILEKELKQDQLGQHWAAHVKDDSGLDWSGGRRGGQK